MKLPWHRLHCLCFNVFFLFRFCFRLFALLLHLLHFLFPVSPSLPHDTCSILQIQHGTVLTRLRRLKIKPPTVWLSSLVRLFSASLSSHELQTCMMPGLQGSFYGLPQCPLAHGYDELFFYLGEITALLRCYEYGPVNLINAFFPSQCLNPPGQTGLTFNSSFNLK